MKTIRFLWWNLQDFAHYDEARRQTLRWPSSAHAFEAKLERVALALGTDSQRNGRADVIALGEVTRRAAHALRDRAFPGYEVHALDLDTPPYLYCPG